MKAAFSRSSRSEAARDPPPCRATRYKRDAICAVPGGAPVMRYVEACSCSGQPLANALWLKQRHGRAASEPRPEREDGYSKAMESIAMERRAERAAIWLETGEWR